MSGNQSDIDIIIKLIGFKHSIVETIDTYTKALRESDKKTINKYHSIISSMMNVYDRHQNILANTRSGSDDEIERDNASVEFISDSDDELENPITRHARTAANLRMLGLEYSADPDEYELSDSIDNLYEPDPMRFDQTPGNPLNRITTSLLSVDLIRPVFTEDAIDFLEDQI